TVDAVHAAEKVERAGPGEERGEEGREDDELVQSEKEWQHGYRCRAYDVRDLPGGFRAEAASETDLDRDEQTRLCSSGDDECDRSDVQLTPLAGTIRARCKDLVLCDVRRSRF